MRLASSICVVLGFLPNAMATEPFQQVVITRQNADSFDFVVTWDRTTEGRKLKVLAPRAVMKNCPPTASWLWLHDSSGAVVYDQQSTIGPIRAGPEIRGTLYGDSSYAIIWIFYTCPDGHRPNGFRYEVDSRNLPPRAVGN